MHFALSKFLLQKNCIKNFFISDCAVSAHKHNRTIGFDTSRGYGSSAAHIGIAEFTKAINASVFRNLERRYAGNVDRIVCHGKIFAVAMASIVGGTLEISEGEHYSIRAEYPSAFITKTKYFAGIHEMFTAPVNMNK